LKKEQKNIVWLIGGTLMYISRVRLNPKAINNSEFWQHINNNYQMHSQIWSMFGDNPDRKRDFLYRQDEMKGVPVFYIVSQRKPDESKGTWELECKNYEPELRSGQTLSFVLRANPIVSKRDENGNQHRHDIVMDAKFHLKSNNISKDECPLIAEIVQEKGIEWLKRRAEDRGFEIQDGQVRADGYMNHKFYKPKGKHKISISTIDFTGLLTVTEPDVFKENLFYGIGPAKSFGCGLMLVKPVR